MTEIVQETVTTENVATNTDKIMTTPVKAGATKSETTEYLIYYIFGALEILLAFRLVLKILGASTSSAFVGFIYGLSGIFIMPFEGIFRRGVSEGLETASVLEPATLVAIIVYAFVGWGIVKLVRISSGEQQAS
ncbi:MAG: hypothetical protein UV00_C0011G0021 [candidate division WWE3 bacterium GW2011_GWF1_42_14]|uniref:YGGT family protein n=2 Tax=Katanobacteria TaxID=422282 RepID=A0A0G1BK35_UNCKA|nr:MAG: hypothetical protein UU92_C0007G0054 [candidate division WWE3 bacterium GW2011_GWA1_42_12]KKS34731.1 MAG: hypothetical protein UU97_C0007G0021 [candidate division WWE3 bacterium GW2011_GWD1_42_14]KKS37838.1 MAG: hypothetical protein UV00_C0011G0021 [candidate division WWE3 bacterium GW2011_GWF1_42_14]KKS40204.1 MAG: hypothetical protein UV03_C0010G0021 [candidate division WWE3 bacterium GW2011_GWE1_42_16]KKS66187.1 MAG: hypothetical protein UV35_C0023G0015 [candidate division WWE3 bacte